MNAIFVVHATFIIDRFYEATPAQVFAAFSDPAIRDRWFTKSNDWPIAEYSYDFRPDGRETGRFSPDGKKMIYNETVYRNIVPDQRIISAYTMIVGDTPISTSLATTELLPQGSGTRLIYTEQGALLDGKDQASDREAGCRALFESLNRELQRQYAKA